MSIVERSARLTELARRVWPQHERLELDIEPDFGMAAVCDGHPDDPDTGTLLKIEDVEIERALDALEAALRALLDEPAPGGLGVPALEALRADMVSIAADWEAEAAPRPPGGQHVTDMVAPNVKRRLRECAAQLRTLAKGQP